MGNTVIDKLSKQRDELRKLDHTTFSYDKFCFKLLFLGKQYILSTKQSLDRVFLFVDGMIFVTVMLCCTCFINHTDEMCSN